MTFLIIETKALVFKGIRFSLFRPIDVLQNQVKWNQSIDMGIIVSDNKSLCTYMTNKSFLNLNLLPFYLPFLALAELQAGAVEFLQASEHAFEFDCFSHILNMSFLKSCYSDG